MRIFFYTTSLLLGFATFQSTASSSWQEYPKPVEIAKYNDDPMGFLLRWNWLAALDGGIQFQTNTAQTITVNNGSGFSSPYNLDEYSTKDHIGGIISVYGGYSAQYKRKWLPNYSLAFRYRYMTPTDVGRYVTQFSLPQFQNYTYSWKTQSNIFTIQGKTNPMQFGAFSPYVGVGLGFAANSTKTYAEQAITPVTPRISPSFGSRANNNFTYNLSAGIDYAMGLSWIVSLGYEFQDLGSIESDYGAGRDWSTQRLSLGNFSGNLALITLSYLYE